MREWTVLMDGRERHIALEGVCPRLGMRVSVDGERREAPVARMAGHGWFYRCALGDSELIIGMRGKPSGAWLAVDGVDVRTGTALEAGLLGRIRALPDHPQVPAAWARGGPELLGLFAACSYIALLLDAVQSRRILPFSAAFPRLVLEIADVAAAGADAPAIRAAGGALALLLVSVYTLLALLAGRRVWPVWAALALLLGDCAVLALRARGSLPYYAADLLAHAALAAVLARVLLAHAKMGRHCTPAPPDPAPALGREAREQEV